MKKMFFLVMFALIIMSGFVIAEESATTPTSSNSNCGLVSGKIMGTVQSCSGEPANRSYAYGENVYSYNYECSDGFSETVTTEIVDNKYVCRTVAEWDKLASEKCKARCPLVCKDSDDGLSYFVRGQTTVFNPNPQSTSQVFDDKCLNSVTLSEGYCKGSELVTQKYDCPNGCSDGVCVQKVDGGTSSGGSGGDESSCLDKSDSYWDQQTNKCYTGFSKELVAKSCSDPDGGIDKYIQAHTYGFRSIFADSRDQRIRTGGKDSCVSDKQLVENYCDSDGYIQTNYLDCANGCKNGACVKGDEVTETITCYFQNSKSGNECYLAGQIYPADEGTKFCKGTESCTIKFSAQDGDKITWKSSCGGYQYTVQDGQDEKVVFECGKGEITPALLTGGFRYSYWQCYDGKEQNNQDESSCKPASLWKKYASEFCNDRCANGKCGVSSFSLSNSCYYPNAEQDSGIVSTVPAISPRGEGIGGVVGEEVKLDDSVLVCKDSCPLDGKCYPFGYRKGDKYCTDKSSFEPQLEGNLACENNFECGSNVCVNNQCVSQGFIEKVISWFKKLFGG